MSAKPSPRPTERAPDGELPLKRYERHVLTDLDRQWQKDNAELIKGWNDWVDKNGLPLDKYRVF